jgi:hypothetical protein
MTPDEFNKVIWPDIVKERFDFWNNELKPFCIDQGFDVMSPDDDRHSHFVYVKDDRNRPAQSSFLYFGGDYGISLAVMAINTVIDGDKTIVQFASETSWDKVESYCGWTQHIKDSDFGEYWIQQRTKCSPAYFEKFPGSSLKNSVLFRLTEYPGPMRISGSELNYDAEWKLFKKDIFKGILEVRKKYNFARNLMRKIEIEDAANGYNL